jgi:DNA-binding transcriptional regulator PaaX
MYEYHGLKGADRIVLEDLCRLLAAGETVSITRLADESGYSDFAIKKALKRLREYGYIEMEHSNGCRAEYRVEEDILDTIIRSIINMVRMDEDERARRMMNALVSNNVYGKGRKLRKLARKLRPDSEIRQSVEAYLENNRILEVAQVWDLAEANAIREHLEKLTLVVREVLE